MSLQHDYTVIHENAALGAVSARRQIAVAGPDRATYLQGLLTNDIVGLLPGSGCYSAWLTAQGRMLTDLHVLQSDGMLLLDVPAEQEEATLARLDQFLFAEDVRLESLASTLAGVWLHGPRAAAVLETVLRGAAGLAGWPDYHHETAAFGDAPVSVARIDQVGVPGYCVFVDAGHEASLRGALEAAGAVTVSAAALTAARIEAGYPVFGVDMDEETIPLEAGIETRAISFTKGCYVGQEIIIRVLHRGGGRVAKRLVALRIEGGEDAAAGGGSKVFAGAREVGRVTSAAYSPRLGAIALAYVHRDFVAPGTAVAVEGGAGRMAAQVADRPIGAAEGA